jgi:hypothetical protein
MIISKDEAPAAFMQRYQKIKDSEEKLDSVAKLKEFWLFAIEQGNDRPYVERARIADAMFEVPVDSDLRDKLSIDYKMVYNELESYRVTALDEDSVESQQSNDFGWRFIADLITKLK